MDACAQRWKNTVRPPACWSTGGSHRKSKVWCLQQSLVQVYTWKLESLHWKAGVCPGNLKEVDTNVQRWWHRQGRWWQGSKNRRLPSFSLLFHLDCKALSTTNTQNASSFFHLMLTGQLSRTVLHAAPRHFLTIQGTPQLAVTQTHACPHLCALPASWGFPGRMGSVIRESPWRSSFSLLIAALHRILRSLDSKVSKTFWLIAF